MIEDLTVCICTYNEESNIEPCINSIRDNGVVNILVVDASTDNTKRKAENLGAKVVTCEKGLARQRQVAINRCVTKYLGFVDADDRLDSACLSILLKEITKAQYDAIQATVRVYNPKTYWEKAINATWQYGIFKIGSTNMIGRPAIYHTKAIRDVGADLSFVNIGDEDTAISIRMEQKGYKQGIGSGISYRKCQSTFSENKKVWIKYGKGDAMIVKKYPEKRNALYKHLIVNYPIKRSWDLIKNGKGIYCLYTVLIGYTRLFVLWRTLYCSRRR